MDQVDLQKRAEQERSRNANLRKIVENIQNGLDQRRKDAKNKQDDTGKIMVSDLKKALKNAELDGQKLIQRHNEAVAQNNKLKETVNTARNERIVHSGIFKNLQKEIRLYESTYKFLLVQRRIQERNARKTVQHLDRLRRSAEAKLQSLRTSNNHSQYQSIKQIPEQSKHTHEQPKKRTILMKRNCLTKTQFNIREIEIQREKLRNYEQILDTLKTISGLEDILDIDQNEEQIKYDIDQLYETSCAINEDIQELQKQIQEEHGKIDKHQEYSQIDEEERALMEAQKDLQRQIMENSNDIVDIYKELQSIGKRLGIQKTNPDEICHQLELKLEQKPVLKQPESLSDILSETPKQQQQENKLNSLLQKSRQIKQIDQILSVTQFKQAFKEISNKQSENKRK